MSVQLLSVVAYYGNVIGNFDLCYQYFVSTNDTHVFTWVILVFFGLDKIIGLFIFIVPFSKYFPHSRSKLLKPIFWGGCCNGFFTLLAFLLYIHPLLLVATERGWYGDPPEESSKRRPKTRADLKKEKEDMLKWKEDVQLESMQVLSAQYVTHSVVAGLPCFAVHLYLMSLHGVSTYKEIVVCIFGAFIMMLSAVGAGRFVLNLMTADVSGRDVMQFANVRDLASSMWMGIPVLLVLITHVLPVGLFSAVHGQGGLVFIFLVYSELTIFILPWVMTEGKECCCGIERCRTRFLLVAQTLCSLLSWVLGLAWFIPEIGDILAEGLGVTSTTESPVSSNVTMDPNATDVATVATTLPNTLEPTTVSNVSTPDPGYHLSEGARDTIFFVICAFEAATWIFYIQIIIKATVWLRICKEVGKRIFRPNMDHLKLDKF